MNYSFFGQTEQITAGTSFQQEYDRAVSQIESGRTAALIDGILKRINDLKKTYSAFIQAGLITSAAAQNYADEITSINAMYSALLDSGLNLSGHFPSRWQQVQARHKGLDGLTAQLTKMNPALGDVIGALKRDASLAVQKGQLDHPALDPALKSEFIKKAYDTADPYSHTTAGNKVRAMFEKSGTPKSTDLPSDYSTGGGSGGGGGMPSGDPYYVEEVPAITKAKIPNWLLGAGAAAIAYFTFFR